MIGGHIHHPYHSFHSESALNNNPNHEPRLARLTEAEISEMAEIDYASVGNMPPQSVRDDENHDILASFPDVSGGSSGFRGRGTFSEGTQTTLQESVSMTCDCCGSGSIMRNGRLIDDEAVEELMEEGSREENVVGQREGMELRISDAIDRNMIQQPSFLPGCAENIPLYDEGDDGLSLSSLPKQPAVVGGNLKWGDEMDDNVGQTENIEHVARAL